MNIQFILWGVGLRWFGWTQTSKCSIGSRLKAPICFKPEYLVVVVLLSFAVVSSLSGSNQQGDLESHPGSAVGIYLLRFNQSTGVLVSIVTPFLVGCNLCCHPLGLMRMTALSFSFCVNIFLTKSCRDAWPDNSDAKE